MSESDYVKQSISKIGPYRRLLALVCLATLILGFAGDIGTGQGDKLNLFSMTGGVVVTLVAAFFFWMEITGFLTGTDGNDLFNSNHHAQRSYLAKFEGPLLISGTFVWSVGEVLVNLTRCGAFVC